MRFSIIVPVYNVEKYIEACMETLVNQSFRDYEIIVVDDESPDGSMEIVNRYAQADPDRIRVVHQKNTRQGGARNHGVRLARGEYILFVDSDDYVTENMLETVDRRLRETPCDVLVFRYVPVSDRGKPLNLDSDPGLKPGVYHPARDPQVLMLPCGPVNKAYRRSFYQEIGLQFPEHVLYEDGVTRLAYAAAETLVVRDDRLYYYVIRENSTMHQKISEKMLDILTVTDQVCRDFKSHGLYEAFREPLEVSLIYSIFYILELINREEPDNPMQKAMADYIGSRFPDYGSNPGVSPALKRGLDCLLRHRFRWYHYRFLLWNRSRERLLAALKGLLGKQ